MPNSLAGLPGESAARETLAGYFGAPTGGQGDVPEKGKGMSQKMARGCPRKWQGGVPENCKIPENKVKSTQFSRSEPRKTPVFGVDFHLKKKLRGSVLLFGHSQH